MMNKLWTRNKKNSQDTSDRQTDEIPGPSVGVTITKVPIIIAFSFLLCIVIIGIILS